MASTTNQPGTTPRPAPVAAPPALDVHPADAWRDLREVLWISFPMVIAMASNTAMSVADSLMLGHVGVSQLAALGPAGSAFFVVAAFIIGTGNGGATFAAQSYGKNQPLECARYTWQGFYFAFLAQAIGLALWPLAPGFFGLFPHAPEVRAMETSFFQIRLLHLFGTACYATLSSFFLGTQRPLIPMVAALIANVVNIGANYVLIFGKFGLPALGVSGSAAGTVIASYTQVLVLFIYFVRRREREQYGTLSNLRFHWARFKALMRVGLPIGISFSLDVSSWAIFALLIIGSLGAQVMAAHTAAMNLQQLSFMPVVGLNQGVVALVGKYIGAGNIRAAKSRLYYALAVGMIYMTLMGLAFLLFRHSLMKVFLDRSVFSTADFDAVVRAGGIILIFAAIFQAFDALGIISQGGLRGAGDTRFAAIVAIVLAWCVFVPLGYVLTEVMHWGVSGAWLSATVYTILVGIVLFRRFISEKWRNIDIFKGTETAP